MLFLNSFPTALSAVVTLAFTEEVYSILEGPMPVVVCLEIIAGADFPTERLISADVSTIQGTALGNCVGCGGSTVYLLA